MEERLSARPGCGGRGRSSYGRAAGSGTVWQLLVLALLLLTACGCSQ